MIHGHVRLDFCDALTGKVKDRVEGDNAFTNAIDSLLNKCPFGWDRRTMDGTGATFESQLNFVTSALGGVVLFGSEVTAGANALYEPLTNQPTAYARFGDQDTSDNKTGYFSSHDSGNIANGYKFVYEWGASFGNGNIKTICLTNKYGGQAWRKGAYWQDKFDFYGKTADNQSYGFVLGYLDGYVYYVKKESTGADDISERLSANNSIVRIKRPMNEMLLNQMMFNQTVSPGDGSAVAPETVWTNDKSQIVRMGLDTVGKQIYIMYGETDYNKEYITIDVSGNSFTPSSPITLSNTSGVIKNPGNNTLIAKRGNYLYFAKTTDPYTDNCVIKKIDLTNNANHNEYNIVQNCTRYNNLFLLTDTNEISGGGYVLDTSDNIHYLDITNAATAGSYMDRYGIWRLHYWNTLGVTIDPCYMASKYVLDDVKVKDNTKTMKLIYEVTHS